MAQTISHEAQAPVKAEAREQATCKEAPAQSIDLEALALHLEAIRGRIVLYMSPHHMGRTEAEQRRHVLQAEAYKTCAASLMAAASAIRTYMAQQDL